MRRIRVLLADDYVLFRESLAALLETEPDFEVVGEAGDGLAAVAQAPCSPYVPPDPDAIWVMESVSCGRRCAMVQ